MPSVNNILTKENSVISVEIDGQIKEVDVFKLLEENHELIEREKAVQIILDDIEKVQENLPDLQRLDKDMHLMRRHVRKYEEMP